MKTPSLGTGVVALLVALLLAACSPSGGGSVSLAVERWATAIGEDSTTTVAGVTVGEADETTFTIRNTGMAELTIDSVTSDGADFTISRSPTSPVPVSGATEFAVRFAPSSVGTKTARLTIASNASRPFVFAVRAVAAPALAPTLVVSLEGVDVATGATVPVTGATPGTPSETVFTLRNTGTSVLAIGGVTVQGADFALSHAPASSVAAGASTTFTLSFAPSTAGTKAAQVTISSNAGADLAFTVSAMATPFVYFVKQALGTTTASMRGGTITVAAAYGASGNAFKYVAPNFYGTNSNGFIAYPTPLTGDFSVTAEVTVVKQNKANNACGIGLGLTTGFASTDSYAYMALRNSSNVANALYVGSATSVNAGAPTVAFADGTAVRLVFGRTGTALTYGAGPVGGTTTTTTAETANFTNGMVYADGPVYPALSFNNVEATITNLVIKDGSGSVIYDSSTGALRTYVSASLTLSTSTANLRKGASTSIIATAVAAGGATSDVAAVAADPSIVEVSVSRGTTSSVITLTGLKGGSTTVTVTNTADPGAATRSKALLVAVNEYSTTGEDYGPLTAYPMPGATDAPIDGELALHFDAPPTLTPGGSIKVFRVSDGAEVDSVAFADETQTYGTTVIKVGSQLVRVDGNSVAFTPHLGKLAYDTEYDVAIPTWAITGKLNGKDFAGLSPGSAVATWRFKTRSAPALSPTNITVDAAQTSVANFRTLSGALGAVRTRLASATDVTINVAAGTYRELVRYVGPGASQTVRILGPPGNTKGDTCVVQYTNGDGLNGSTQTRPVFYFTGAHLVLENLTIRNTAVRSAVAQAEALSFAGAGLTMAARNSSFSSNQDTVLTEGRNWFYQCFIEGNVDFIWGTADAALFEDCDLHVRRDVSSGVGTYSLVVARTGTLLGTSGSGRVGKGYVLFKSRVKVDDHVTAYLGRVAGAGNSYDQVAFIDVAFTAADTGTNTTVGAGMWDPTTKPTALGDSSYVGWKSAGCTGLNLADLTPANASGTIASQSTEYDTREHILNRVVAVTNGVPVGFEPAASAWDVSSLASAWGAP